MSRCLIVSVSGCRERSGLSNYLTRNSYLDQGALKSLTSLNPENKKYEIISRDLWYYLQGVFVDPADYVKIANENISVQDVSDALYCDIRKLPVDTMHQLYSTLTDHVWKPGQNPVHYRNQAILRSEELKTILSTVKPLEILKGRERSYRFSEVTQ